MKPVRRPLLGWFWILPGVVLVIVSGVVLFSLSNRGERILIHFDEGHGLKSGDAVRCRNITVGEVRSVELSPDLKGVDVVIDLRPTAGGIGAEDSQFWIVRPQAALTGVSGLETVVGAKYVAVNPGSGKAKRSFRGLEEPPLGIEPGGLKIVLKGKRMGGLRKGVPLIYRQVRIGSVLSAKLVPDGSGVEVEVFVLPQHKKLVRENSEFWNVSGFKLEGSVVSGLTLAAESAETLLAGGVAMATFGEARPPARDGQHFELADAPPKDRGERIFLHFKEGHGLKQGDSLRHRGITLGEVRSVQLSDDKASVDVVIDLWPTVRGIAVVDSRFWIVRPQADLTGVSGLDTVVGAKYVAVSPGSGGGQHKFVGLEEPPVLERLEPGGLEIVLHGKRRGGLRPGVPLTYRQVRIGSVVKARLASDGSAVDFHVYVLPAYTRLVSKDSKFWNVSGLKMEFGLRGLTVNAESAETLLAGGVAMATEKKPAEPVRNGKRFELHDEPDKEWLTWNPSIPLIDLQLPPGKTVPRLVRATLEYELLGKLYGKTTKQLRGLLLPVDKEGENWLLGPGDLLSVPSKAVRGQGELAFEGVGQPISAHLSIGKQATPALHWFKVDNRAVKEKLKEWLPKKQLRPPTPGDEDCWLVADSSSDPLLVSKARLKRTEKAWTIDPSLSGSLISETWHGAAVVSGKDGDVIGLLWAPNKGPKVIIPLTTDLLRH
jgi:paraquat-inducible protein B